MAKRKEEEASPPTLERSTTGPDFIGYYEAQVAELLSQKEKIPHHEHEEAKTSSTEIIGAEMSSLKREKLNVLLRQCVRDSIPDIDEMHLRVLSQHQMNNKKAEDPTMDEDMRLLMRADPSLVKNLMSKHSDDLSAKLGNMVQQYEKLLNNVVATCRPMTRGEKRDLQKAIKELPEENLKRVAEIVKNHYTASGKRFSDDIVVNMEEADDVMLWRLHFHIGAVKKAREFASK